MAYDDVKQTGQYLPADEYNALIADLKSRLPAPTNSGSVNQVIARDANGNPYWANGGLNGEIIVTGLTNDQLAGITSATPLSGSNPVMTRDDVRRIKGRKFV